jgi:hypothetical protein
MKTKHTPGPWKVSFERIDPDLSLVTNSVGNVIAIVNSETGPDIPPLVSTKMPKDANARLIAAAPELLKVVKMAMRELEALKILIGYPAFIRDVPVERCRSAIAKAEGST